MKFAELREVAAVISGQHVLEPDYNSVGKGIGYLTGPSDFGFLHPSVSRWTEKPRIICEPGDVLVTVKGAGVGKINFAPDVRVAIGRQLMAVRSNPEQIDRDFLFCWLLSEAEHFRKRSVGATVPGLSREDLEGLSIQLPNIAVQRQIAARLNAQLADVETARQAAHAQMRDMALLRRRVLDDFFAALGEVPLKVLGEYAQTTSGSTPSRGNKRYWESAEVPWVKTAEVRFAPITATEEAISRVAMTECSLALLPPKTVLLAMYGQGRTRGQSAILEISATTNQACFAILPNDTWEPEFLYYWLVASYQDLRDLSDDRGGNQANLNGALLNALEVPAPDRSTQEMIVRRIRTALAELDALNTAVKVMLAELDQLPQRLLAQNFEK